jgi:hypothetical protein
VFLSLHSFLDQGNYFANFKVVCYILVYCDYFFVDRGRSLIATLSVLRLLLLNPQSQDYIKIRHMRIETFTLVAYNMGVLSVFQICHILIFLYNSCSYACKQMKLLLESL